MKRYIFYFFKTCKILARADSLMETIKESIPYEDYVLLEKGELDTNKYYQKPQENSNFILEAESPTSRNHVFKSGGKFIEVNDTQIN